MNRLGIDIGRVIIDGSSRSGDTSFFSGDTAAMLRTPAVPGAFAAIARLVRCSERHGWSRSAGRFCELTGVAEGNWVATEAAILRDLRGRASAVDGQVSETDRVLQQVRTELWG